MSPGSAKSSIVVRSVALATARSPRAASTASAHASSVPPTQKPSALTVLLPAISLRDARCARRARPARGSRPSVRLAELGRDVAPRDHEHRVPLRDGQRDERVLGLQIEDVVLVDARRHDHERPPVDASASSARTGSARSARCGTRRCRASRRGCARPRTRARRSSRCGPAARRRRDWRAPARGSRPRSRARASSTSGLVARKFVGASASTYCRVRNASRRLSCSGQRGERGELVQVFAEEQIALLQQREVRQLAPLARREAAIARRGLRDVRDRPRPLRVGYERGHRRRPERFASAPGICALSAASSLRVERSRRDRGGER